MPDKKMWEDSSVKEKRREIGLTYMYLQVDNPEWSGVEAAERLRPE